MGKRKIYKPHHEKYWDVIKRIITESDLVLEILDARFVDLTRNQEIEELIKQINRPVIFVINKSDLVSKNYIKKQAKELKKIGNVIFISAKTKGSAKIILYNIKRMFKKHGKREFIERDKFDKKPIYKEIKADIAVGVLGYPNVGKSSIINALAHKKKVKVSKKPGTTHGIHWIKISNEIKLIDSPGVIPLKEEDEMRHALISAKTPERLKNPEFIAEKIIKLFMNNKKQKLEKFYDLKIKEKEPYKILNEISKRKSHLIKGGNPDINRTSLMIIRDWQQGRLVL